MELNYKSFGQGDPIVILHGLFGTLDNWQTIAKKLADKYMVYIVDQRNHGKSPHAAPMDYPTLAADLKAFLESQWIHHAHIIGHSMGGKTAMQFALDYPDFVDELIVVDIAPKAYAGGHQAIFDALFSIDIDALQSRSEAEEILKSRIDEEGVRLFLLKNLTRKKEGGFRWKMNLPVIHQHYQDILAPIESMFTFDDPALFIRGGKSDYILDTDLDGIKEPFPAASLETIPEAGHWIHAEAPAAFLDVVKKVLK